MGELPHTLDDSPCLLLGAAVSFLRKKQRAAHLLRERRDESESRVSLRQAGEKPLQLCGAASNLSLIARVFHWQYSVSRGESA